MSRRLPLFDGEAREGPLPTIPADERLRLPSPSVLLFAVDAGFDPAPHIAALLRGFDGKAGFITSRVSSSAEPPERTFVKGEAPFSPPDVAFSGRVSAPSGQLPDRVAELAAELPSNVPIVGWGAALVACSSADVVVIVGPARQPSHAAARLRSLAAGADLRLPSGREGPLRELAARLSSRPR